MFNPVHYISHGDTPQEQLYHIESVLDAGQTWVQYRFKNTLSSIRWNTAEKVQLLCQTYKATLLINDDVHLALAIEADGVHLGLQDMPIEQAKRMLPNRIIGGTANTLQDVKQRLEEQCSYIGIGPFRYTKTKANLSPILGISGYQHLIESLEPIPIPLVAIGGITLADLPVLKDLGLDGIAISSLLQASKNVKETLNQINQYFL